MIESISENKKKSCNNESCRECGGSTLVWNGMWKLCAQCNAVFAKRDLITDTNTDDKTMEPIAKDEIVSLAHTNNEENGKCFYINYKAVIILIPILSLGLFLIKFK